MNKAVNMEVPGKRNAHHLAWITGNASLLALIALAVFFGTINTRFFTLSNLFNILNLVALLCITASAMSFVLMMGSIDLSVEGIVGLSGVAASFLVSNFTNANDFGFFALMVCIGLGACLGMLNGFVFSTLKIPSFMTTLGVGFVTIGIGILLTRGTPVVITDWTFRQIGVGRIAVIPYAFVIAAIVMFMMWFVNEWTIFGRYVLAIGGDEAVVKDLGIRINRVKIGVFGMAGMLYGLVGAMLTARLGSGDTIAPLGFTFDAIGACVLGGIAITGGVGSIPKTFIGALILTVLRNGMVLMGISPYIQQGIVGVILIATVALTIDRKKIKNMK